MSSRMHQICRGEVLTPEKCEAYRRRWLGLPDPPRPEEPPPVRVKTKPQERKPRPYRRSQPLYRWLHALTVSCGYLGKVVSKEPCSCGDSKTIEVHECRLLKTLVSLSGRGGRPKRCVPLQRDYRKMKNLEERLATICCEDCEHYSPPRWISKRKLVEDTDRLLAMLPEGITAVAGHARSGMLPATLVAMALHVPLWMIRSDDEHRDIVPTGHGWRLLKGSPEKRGTLLVVDDNCMTGHSLTRLRPIVAKWAKENLFEKTVEAVVYVNPLAQHQPDLHVDYVPWPCYYEWIFFNSTFSPGFALDFDGILCRDCTPEEDQNEELYREFLRTASPKFLPRREPVSLVVTARQEKYRAETLDWLNRHGIQVKRLVMHPDGERTIDSVVKLKGDTFKEFMKTPASAGFGRHVFVESDDRQAQKIAQISGGMVICPASERVYSGEKPHPQPETKRL